MKTESDEIQDEEWLLRRVSDLRFHTDRIPIVSDSAFEPRLPKNSRDPDLTGISLYRRACLESAKDILKSDQIQNHAVVGIKVSELKSLDLSVINDPEPAETENRVKGYVVIPELACGNYLEKKAELRLKIHKLAEICSADDHIFWNPLTQSNPENE